MTVPFRPDTDMHLSFDHTVHDCEFIYFGNRPYVQGVIGLRGMLQTAEAFLPDLLQRPGTICQIKVMREITTHARATTMRTEDVALHPGLSDTLMRMDIVSGGERLTSLLNAYPDRPVTERQLEYAFGDYVRQVSLGQNGTGSGTMRPMSGLIELLCGVEECFRDIIILESGLPREKLIIRWAFAEDFPLLGQDETERVDRVDFSPARLIPSATGTFHLRRGTLRGPTPEKAFNMCFHVVNALDAAEDSR